MTTNWGANTPLLPPALLGPARELAACALNALVQGLDDQPETLAPSAGPAAGDTPAPVVLVHGYGGTKTQWFPIQRSLRAAGFGWVRTFEYDAQGTDIPTIAGRLVREVRSLLAETGAARAHLVGHSLGGVVIRYAVTALGLDAVTGAAVTIASPHRGSPAAWAGSGNVAAQLRPGSSLLGELEARADRGQARWLGVYAGLDAVVPASSARITTSALAATNLRIAGEGHLSVLWSPHVSAAVAAHLRAADQARCPAGLELAA
jgi:triacylglycerol esterase/lipase EstA (alpha/beta hydrolase family)